MAEKIVTSTIEADLIDRRIRTPETTVSTLAPMQVVARDRERVVDTLDDALKWFEKLDDPEKRKEIETGGTLIRWIASVDESIKKKFPEPKVLSEWVDPLLKLYPNLLKLPEEIIRNSAALWWIATRKARKEGDLPRLKKEAEAFHKDPYTYIQDNQAIFDEVNIEEAFISNAGGMILTEGLFQPSVSDASLYASALEFTRAPGEYPDDSAEFQSYVDVRVKVVEKKFEKRFTDPEKVTFNSVSRQVIHNLLYIKIQNPGIANALDAAIFGLRRSPAETTELQNLFRNTRISVEDLLGSYNTSYNLAMSFVNTQGLVEKYKRNNPNVNRFIVSQKAWEIGHKLLPAAINQPVVQQEVAYLLELYAQGRTDEEVQLFVQSQTAQTGVNPVPNLLGITFGDYKSLRWLLTNPVGTLEIAAKNYFATLTPRVTFPTTTQYMIILALQGNLGTNAWTAMSPQMIMELRSLYAFVTDSQWQTITNAKEFDDLLTYLKSDFEGKFKGTTKNPGVGETLKSFEQSAALTQLTIEPYSYFGLPPFASSADIDVAVKPFQSLRDNHKAVIDISAGRIQPKFEKLAQVFQLLESKSPGLMEKLTNGGFFYYRFKDPAALKADLGKYKGQYYRDLNTLKGDWERLSPIPNPIAQVRHALDLDYSPPTHGIKHYFDLIYGAAKAAGVNQSVIDSIIVDKSTLLRELNAEGNEMAIAAKPEELTILALYVANGNNALETARKLDQVVSTALALKSNASFKATYDSALLKSIQREEGFSTSDIERKIVSMNRDKSAVVYLGTPEEILYDSKNMTAYKSAVQQKIKYTQAQLSGSNVRAFIDTVLTAPGNISTATIVNDAARMADLFLVSPVDAQSFGDVVYLLSRSFAFKAALFGPNFATELNNIDSPLSKEVLRASGLLTAPDSLKRRHLRGIRDTASSLYRQVFARNDGVFGVNGNAAALNGQSFLRFIYTTLGNPLDYVNGSQSVRQRVTLLRSKFTDQDLRVVLQPGTSQTVDIRGKLSALADTLETGFDMYASRALNLNSPEGDLGLRTSAVRDMIAKKNIIGPFAKGGDARTLSLLKAMANLDYEIGKLGTSTDRFEEAFGDKVLK